MRSKLTPAFAAKAATAPGASRTVYWDVSLPCFGLMVTTNGRKSYVVQYRAAGRSRRLHLKQGLTLRAARKEAMAILGAVAKGGDPLGERRITKRAESDTLRAIVEEYLTREGGRLRSIAERRRALEHHVLPKLGARQIGSITRSDIVRLLDRIADNSGAPMADHVLAYLRRVMTWHASRSDDFRSPVVRGMVRTRPSQRRRQRVLSDVEIRAVWRSAEAFPSVFGYLVQFLLLTATRRTEAAHMRRRELVGDEWVIPPERYKTSLELVIPLSPAAQGVLAALPQIGKGGLVFTTDGKRPIGGFPSSSGLSIRRCSPNCISKARTPNCRGGRYTICDGRRGR
jgi:integrase